MKAKATVALTCADARARRSLESVLAPDNEGAPRGLRLGVEGGGRALALTVESDSASSALSTALALLRDAALFDEVWLLSRPLRSPRS